MPDERTDLREGDAQAQALETASRDVIASPLVLNLVPDKEMTLAEMKRVVRPGGMIGFYIWDYPSGGVEFMRVFWNEATVLDPGALSLTEDSRLFARRIA